MAETLYASFADASMAEKAAGALMDHGADSDAISLVAHESSFRDRKDSAAHSATLEERRPPAYPETTTAGVYATGSPTPVIDNPIADDEDDLDAKSGISTTTAGDAAAGAVKGAAIGLGAGALAAVASLMIPGFGFILGGGALATAIAGAAGATAAGAVAGGVYGYLKDQGVPEDVAMRYEEAYRAGGAVLSVTVPSNDLDRMTAESILAKYGAANVGTYGVNTA